jgi:hypothetical protein
VVEALALVLYSWFSHGRQSPFTHIKPSFLRISATFFEGMGDYAMFVYSESEQTVFCEKMKKSLTPI